MNNYIYYILNSLLEENFQAFDKTKKGKQINVHVVWYLTCKVFKFMPTGKVYYFLHSGIYKATLGKSAIRQPVR